MDGIGDGLNLMKRLVLIAIGIFAALSVHPIYTVGVGLGFWQPLTRPPGVSPRAHFIPTMKSETWLDCSIEHTKRVDACRAWDEHGNPIAFGNYRFEREDREASVEELRPCDVMIYPGHPQLAWIRLSNGAFLVPVNAAGQPLERFEVHVGGER